MAKFNPGTITNDQANVSDKGLAINLILPHKTFSSGKEGFFKQGMFTAEDGVKYRLNLQAYKIEPKGDK